MAEYSRAKKRLFSNNPCTYTRCQERIEDYQLVAGGFYPSGLEINYCDESDYAPIGIAVLRKL